MPEEMKKAQEEKAAADRQKVPVVASAMVEAGRGPHPLGKVPVASTPSSTPAAAGAAKVSSQAVSRSLLREQLLQCASHKIAVLVLLFCLAYDFHWY